MKKSKKEERNFKLSIKEKGHEPVTYSMWEFVAVCWDYIYELESGNPSLYSSNNELLESLKENFYTCKHILTERGHKLDSELESIEQFIHKHSKRLLLADLSHEIASTEPKMIISDEN